MKMNYEHIKWACRRGMLELDLILTPYVLERYPTASPAEQTVFIDFLASADQDLFDWLLKKKQPSDPRFSKMIEVLLHDPH